MIFQVQAREEPKLPGQQTQELPASLRQRASSASHDKRKHRDYRRANRTKELDDLRLHIHMHALDIPKHNHEALAQRAQHPFPQVLQQGHRPQGVHRAHGDALRAAGHRRGAGQRADKRQDGALLR